MRAAIALLALAGAAAAQEDLEAKLAAKLFKPFVKNADWVLDFDEARRKSKERNKPIFAYFTRSDQPDPGSAQVEDGVFSSEAFAKLSKDFVMFLHVTTRIPGRKDDMLLFRLGGRSFPYVAILARAEFDEDVAEAERILGKLRELAGEEPEARGFFEKAEARIAELKRTLAAEKPEPEKKRE